MSTKAAVSPSENPHRGNWPRVVESILELSRERLGRTATPLNQNTHIEPHSLTSVTLPSDLRARFLAHFRNIEHNSTGRYVVELPMQGVRITHHHPDGHVTHLLGSLMPDDDIPRPVVAWDFEQPLRKRPVGVSELVDEVSVLCGALSCLGQLVSIARESEGLLRDLRLRMGLFYGMACDLVRALRQHEADDASGDTDDGNTQADCVHEAIEAGVSR